MFFDAFLGIRCDWFIPCALYECVGFGVWRDSGGGYACRGLGDEGPDGVKAGEGFPSSVSFLKHKVAFIGGDTGFG